MPRDRSRQGALAAAVVVAAYLPLQPLLAWAARAAGLAGAGDLDGLARWQPTAVVLLAGAGLAAVLAADWRGRRGAGGMQRWASGAASGFAVLLFLAALLTLAQAMLQWATSQAGAIALAVDAAVLSLLGAVALTAVAPRPEAALRAWPA